MLDLYERVEKALNYVQHPFLLTIRLVWGYQFFVTGRGKLGNLEGVTGFFESLGIPMPGANAVFVSSAECFGGLLLIIGLANRPVGLVLSVMMTVAYLTSDVEALQSVDTFVAAAPFPFLMTALIVFAFGPGLLSADEGIRAVLKRRQDDAE